MRKPITRRVSSPATARAALALTGLMAVAPALAATDVHPIIVPGQATQIQGVDQRLPPLSATGFYQAGAGFADEVRAYRASGQFVNDQRAVAKSAEKFLRKWLVRTCGDTSQEVCKPAVVFDVDDTLLDWYDLESAANFDMPYAQWLTYDEECAMPAIAPTRDLFNAAKKLGATVFIITGGNDAQRPVIVACLRARGIAGWQKLVTRSPAQESLTALVYKSNARAEIEKQGWRIGFAIGDQISDSAGGHTAQGFLLPNPMYFIP